MKKRILTIFFTFILLLCTSCSSDRASIKNPTQLRLQMSLLLQLDNYTAMNDQLLFEQGSITEEEFEELRKKASNKSMAREFNLISYDNGESFLLELVQDAITGEYKIKNITVLSEDAKKLFGDE